MPFPERVDFPSLGSEKRSKRVWKQPGLSQKRGSSLPNNTVDRFEIGSSFFNLLLLHFLLLLPFPSSRDDPVGVDRTSKSNYNFTFMIIILFLNLSHSRIRDRCGQVTDPTEHDRLEACGSYVCTLQRTVKPPDEQAASSASKLFVA